MKTYIKLTSAVAAASFLLGVQSYGFVEIARGSLTAGLSARAEYDTNIFGNNTSDADTIFSFTPDLRYTRAVGKISTIAVAGVNIIRFNEADDENSEDPFASVTFNYDAADKGNARLSIGFARSSQADDTVLDRLKSDEYALDSMVNHFYSEKLGYRVGFGTTISESKTNGFNDVDTYTVSLGSVYRYSQKLNAALTYSFRKSGTEDVDTTLFEKPDSDDHRLTASLEGEISPKVTGQIGVGFSIRDYDEGGSDVAPTLSTGLNWAAAEKTTVSFNATQDFETTSAAQSALRFKTSLGVTQAINAKLNLTGSFGYEHATYENSAVAPADNGRTDDSFIFQAGAAYAFTRYVSANAGITYRDNQSDAARADYERTIVSVGVSARY